jgi:hypothetical protein
MPRGAEEMDSSSTEKIRSSAQTYSMSIVDTRMLISNIEIPDSSLGYPDVPNPNVAPNRSSTLPPRRPSIRVPNEQPGSSNSPGSNSPVSQQSPSRRSKLTSPVFTSLREKDDPYFLALPDSSRTKILSNSAPDLNTLPHPPPRVHPRPPRDVQGNGNGRLMEQLHSSRRHSTLTVSSQISNDRSLSRRSTLRAPFRLQRRGSPSSGSSSPNGGSDSESEIFEDDRSYVGSAASTRPSSFSSTASFSETFLHSSASMNNLNGKAWPRGTPNFSPLDLIKKKDSALLPERDSIEAEDCRFLEVEYHRYFPFRFQLT